MSEEDGVALYVSVDNALCVEDRQRFQDRQTHGGNLLLVHPGKEKERKGDIGEISGFICQFTLELNILHI